MQICWQLIRAISSRTPAWLSLIRLILVYGILTSRHGPIVNFVGLLNRIQGLILRREKTPTALLVFKRPSELIWSGIKFWWRIFSSGVNKSSFKFDAHVSSFLMKLNVSLSLVLLQLLITVVTLIVIVMTGEHWLRSERTVSLFLSLHGERILRYCLARTLARWKLM